MWQAQRQSVESGRGETIRITDDTHTLSVTDVLAGWGENAPFRDFFIAEFAATPFAGFFWELPRVENGRLADEFECAVIRGDSLTKMQADDSDFTQYLSASTAPVAAFRNLGHDALLIAPRRISDADCYGHIAAFMRNAPPEQRHALLQCIAAETGGLLTAGHRFWISTSGLGVPWLHVRLDTDPKYYQYRPYAEVS